MTQKDVYDMLKGLKNKLQKLISTLSHIYIYGFLVIFINILLSAFSTV